jgi:hypothetical protein
VRPAVAALLVAALYVLHQDIWFWRTARPLVFGFLPIGLAYHAAFTLASAGLLWLLTATLWPSHLESVVEGGRTPDPTAGPARRAKVFPDA